MNIEFSKKNGITFVELKGRLDFEKVKSIEMQKTLLSNGKIVFLLDKVSFVGSSGIQLLFQVLADMQQVNPHLRVTGVRAEFEKLVNFSNISHLAIDATAEDSIEKIVHGISGTNLI